MWFIFILYLTTRLTKSIVSQYLLEVLLMCYYGCHRGFKWIMDSCVNIYRSSVYSNSLQFLLWSKLLGDILFSLWVNLAKITYQKIQYGFVSLKKSYIIQFWLWINFILIRCWRDTMLFSISFGRMCYRNRHFDSKYLVIQGEKQYYHGYQRKQHGVNFIICFSNVFFENP